MWFLNVVFGIVALCAIVFAVLFILCFVLYGAKQVISHYYATKLEYVKRSLRLSQDMQEAPYDDPVAYK